MTNKHTKKALLSSALALILCFAMLVGTTFAWFTDSTVAGRNTIKSGNLDVILEYKAPGMTDWAEVTATTSVFNDYALWEPGHTEVVALRVRNVGSLALNYDLSVVIDKETTSTNVFGDTFKLSDYLVVSQSAVNGNNDVGDILMSLAMGSREDALKYCSENLGFNTPVDAGYEVLMPESVTPDSGHVVAIAITMPTTVGNEANHKTGVAAPEITFGVNLVATQVTYESDTFGNDYDKDAKMPIVVVSNAELNNALNAGEDVVLNNDAAVDAPIAPAAGTNQTVDLNGNELEKNGDNQAAVENTNGGNLTISNGTINAGSSEDYSNITGNNSVTTYNNVNIGADGGGVGVTAGGRVIFNSGSVAVQGSTTNPRYNFYVVGDGSEATINGGDFSFSAKSLKRAYIYAGAGTTVTINGGTFGPASTRSGYTDGFLGDGTIIIKGGTFGFNPTKWVAEGYVATESSGTWTVTAK